MNQLNVFENKGQLVIDSREVAEMVERRHSDLIRDIEGYKGIIDQNAKLRSDDFFTESTYRAGTGKSYKCFLLTKQGCEMVANKMTGEKGILFTATYVSRFNEMERQSGQKSLVLTDEQRRREHLKLSIETSERLDQVETKLDSVVNTMRIDGVEQQNIKQRGGFKVIEMLGGKEANAYKKMSRRMFKALWGEFNKHFNIPRYSELPKVNYDEGLKFIALWQPSTSLRIEIEQCNRQMQLRIIKS